MRDMPNFEHDTPPRIMGSETEYNVSHLDDECDFRSFVRELYFRESSRDDGKELWLENGSRLYLDSGGVVEYATPEVTNARDLVAHEKAGEIIVQEMADRMYGEPNPTYKRSGYANVFIDGDLQIAQTTAGHHENYITPLRSYVPQGVEHYNDRSLQCYLSTRAIWAGAGIIACNNFVLSQKQNAIDFSEYTKRAGVALKAPYIVNSDKQLNRLEIRLGDGNMSEWAIQQKFAFTSLVLRLIEHGEFPRYLNLKSSATEAFNNTLFNQPVATLHRHMSPATHQRLIAEAALDFAEDKDVPNEEIEAAQEIIEVCHIIENLDTTFEGASQLAGQIDWAAKKMYLQTMGIKDFSTKNARAVMFDLKWEDIAASGNARKWYDEHHVSELLDRNHIENARVTPPTTRALARISLLASLTENPTTITWERVESRGHIHRFDDPYNYQPI